jgi:hypothetical protein
MQVALKPLSVTVAQDYPELRARQVQQERQVLLVLMAHLVQVDLAMERDMVLAHSVLVRAMMLSKLNSSTYLLADSSR